MCLAAFALDLSARFPLVIASNRDEFHARPTAALAVWTPPGAAALIMAGRDLQAGGTWFGLDGRGRLALLTNIRDPARMRPDAPSRGTLVTDWLTGDFPAEAWWPPIRGAGHNGFNLIAADLARGTCHWLHSDEPAPQPLGAGLYGLSNGRLDEPWPKVRELKRALQGALVAADDASSLTRGSDALAATLLAALSDDRLAADTELPATGVPLALERLLSAIHIRTPDGRYGTRCSTVLIVERDMSGRTDGFVTMLVERNHGADGQPGPTRRARWLGWPPARRATLLSANAEQTGVERAALPLPTVETLDPAHD
jgi:uncharacterized protein with NRDE domain